MRVEPLHSAQFASFWRSRWEGNLWRQYLADLGGPHTLLLGSIAAIQGYYDSDIPGIARTLPWYHDILEVARMPSKKTENICCLRHQTGLDQEQLQKIRDEDLTIFNVQGSISHQPMFDILRTCEAFPVLQRELIFASLLISLAAYAPMPIEAQGTVRAEKTVASRPEIPPSDKTDQDVLKSIANDFMVAWQKQDMNAIAAILSPDFLFAGPHGVVPKATTLKALSHCTLGEFSLEDFQFRRTSADSAILIYKIHRDLACGGKKDLDDTLNTDAFIRRNGKWSILVTTEGVLPPH
jgi:hypothetical protein